MMLYDNIFLFLGISFLLIFIIGKVLGKLRIPWMFGAILLGFIFSFFDNTRQLTSSENFDFLAKLGMYLLLFSIGIRIDTHGLNKMRHFIVKSTIFIIFLEGLIGGVFIYYFFNYSLIVSLLVALSFATVGEAVLIPILDEFKLTKKKLGQVIIGIGTLDDIIEIFLLIFITMFLHTSLDVHISDIFISALILITATLLFNAYTLSDKLLKKLTPQLMILITMIIFLIFLGVGTLGGLEPIAAIFAGISVKRFIQGEAIKTIEYQIQALTYGFFGLIFFIWVGSHIDYTALLSTPLLIIMIVVVSGSTKMFGSIITGRKELGFHKSLALGVALSMRFSTGIVIAKLLYDNAIIGSELYSAIIASSIIFMFIIPITLSQIILKYKLNAAFEHDFEPKITI